MSIKIKLDKQLSVTEDNSAVYAVTLKVVEAVGVTPNIFVVRYTPASKYTGPETYTFWNVAYADELVSVPDMPTNKRKACEIRRSCITYKCSDMSTMNDFISTVTSDIQRLIKSLKNTATIACTTVDITDETAVELPCAEHAAIVEPVEQVNQGNTTISLSFTGE